jgi:hypothetical protein
MLYVRLPNRLQAMRLDQFYDALEPRSNIQRETIERLLDVLIQNSTTHAIVPIIPFLQYSLVSFLHVCLDCA